MIPGRGSVLAVPLADGCADVVVAGEVLEHVADDVADDVVRIVELIRAAPRGIHDPALFVDRRRLLAAADRLGLELRLGGLRPSFRDALAWRLRRRPLVRMLPMRITAVLFAGYGRKR